MELKASRFPGDTEHLSAEEAQALDEQIPIRTFKKGSVLLEAGQLAKDSYLCIKGCVRLY